MKVQKPPEYDVHLNFDQADDEFFAELAKSDPKSLSGQWIYLGVGGRDRERQREFHDALNRAREAYGVP